ncbi:unnamed protein product [Blepharisma stoltei]|uniref:Uncharacterized protein n=1 Tax=Blepharisma stoltei TaxID=1481888 RepID=A0AAU9KAD2_9CILI|nr:unnamed protein product [Blepharisma stoltei]
MIFIAKFLLASALCPYGVSDTPIAGIYYCPHSKMIDDKICSGSDACPSRFTFGKKNGMIAWCFPNSRNDAVIFDLQFSSIKDLTATYIASSTDSTTIFQNPDFISYMSQTQNSPLLTIDRSFYFATTSSTSNSEGFIPGCYFTLNTWIKPLESGEIVNIIYSSTSYIKYRQIYLLLACLIPKSNFSILNMIFISCHGLNIINIVYKNMGRYLRRV